MPIGSTARSRDSVPYPPPASEPAVTVVVLNWCGEPETRECLQSLQRTSYGALRVLLVDNASPDGSGARLRDAFPDVDFLQTGDNHGYTGGNNRGIDRALEQGADYVLVLNNDTVLEPDCVTELVAAAARGGPTVAAVVPKILFHDEPNRIWYAGGHFSPLHGLGLHWREGELDVPSRPEPELDITFVSGCCCLLSAAVLRRVGAFAEELFAYVEDAELSLRFDRAGYRMVYQPTARVLHHSRPLSEPPSPLQIRLRDRNRRHVMSLHFSWWRRIPFLLRFHTTRLVLIGRYAFAGDMARVRAIISGMFGVVR